jgi:hypothetical protein
LNESNGDYKNRKNKLIDLTDDDIPLMGERVIPGIAVSTIPGRESTIPTETTPGPQV